VKHDRTFLNRFNKDFQKIEKEMDSSFSSRIKMIEDIGRHSLLGEGKRLRPLLFVLSGYADMTEMIYITFQQYSSISTMPRFSTMMLLTMPI
jgi:hypothetical protein